MFTLNFFEMMAVYDLLYNGSESVKDFVTLMNNTQTIIKSAL